MAGGVKRACGKAKKKRRIQMKFPMRLISSLVWLRIIY